VICGIIVAGLGVLNDVTITQASAVWELADQGATHKHLFSRAMRIGRDHIASTVYTIAFATAGASLGVFLLIKINNRPLLDVLLTERFAAEVLSILVGSIGLVLAVPLTTAVGVAVVRASGTARPLVRQAGTARTVDTVGKQRPPVVKERALPTQPEHRPTQVPEATTTKLPPVSLPSPPAASNGAEQVSDTQVKRRRLRRHADDDFGDFTYLHDPVENEPKAPESRGRRAL
ncbi:MAG TPA: YibE/F family protein, partial [Propionibacteriaceae bacterium]